MNEPNDRRERSVQFVLEEFGHLEAERLRLKGEAVQRLNFFLTLTSALLGGLVLLGQSSALVRLEYVTLITLLFLSIIGWYTLEYTIGRDINTDRVLRAGARVRRYFTDNDAAIRDYLMWPDHDGPTGYITHNDSAIRRTIGTVLSFLLASAIGLLASIIKLVSTASTIVGIVSFVTLLVGFELYANRRFKQAVREAEAERLHPRRSESETGSEGSGSLAKSRLAGEDHPPLLR